MTFEFIPVRLNRAPAPVVTQLVGALRDQIDNLGLGNTVIYHGWPRFTDYEAVRHPVDLAIVSEHIGVILIRIVNDSNSKQILEVSDSISQAAASAVSQLVRSPILRNRSRQLKVPVVPALYVLGHSGDTTADVEIINSEAALIKFAAEADRQSLSEPEFQEARSILEGAKALVRPTRRHITDPANQKFAAALGKLEEEIASFDQRQRQVALTSLGSPQRIRGLAGSGKTVILAMKAALAHLENPDANILLTFYTRSLRDQITRLITRFHRHFGEGEPDWNKVHIRHGWGRQDLPGVYREACLRAGMSPMNFTTASAGSAAGQEPFDYACRTLLSTTKVAPFNDLMLIDEGQDFPSGFYELCFYMAKGYRDHKQIVWAYDELQNVFDVKVRTPEDLFGNDEDGEPRISLASGASLTLGARASRPG